MQFVPYTDLDGRPNVVVDGATTNGTLLTLSHWPGTDVPESLRADLSAEIAIRYLEQPDHHVPAGAVSNSHFDEDGLLGVYALVDPQGALAHKELLVDVARAGDFGWSHTSRAAKIAFAISTLVDTNLSPLDPAVFEGEYPTMAARLYRELLPMVPELLQRPEQFHDLWADEYEHLTTSDRLLDDDEADIVEYPELDLAIVTTPPELRDRVVHRFTQRRHAGLHPMAVHNRTEMTRVAYVSEGHFEVQLRYETWVQLVSRHPMQRPELAPLAARLNELDAAEADWRFDGAGDITPRLARYGSGESALAAKQFVDELLAFLPTAAPAWDPWHPRAQH
jgi:hypothetical protein